MKSLSRKILDECKKKLLDLKDRHIKTLKGLSGELVAEAAGDVADQARALQEETMALARREKLAQELREINEAIDRIQKNEYGICEETGQIIEEKRLKAVPWTRLSLEGAEIRALQDTDTGNEEVN